MIYQLRRVDDTFVHHFQINGMHPKVGTGFPPVPYYLQYRKSLRTGTTQSVLVCFLEKAVFIYPRFYPTAMSNSGSWFHQIL